MNRKRKTSTATRATDDPPPNIGSPPTLDPTDTIPILTTAAVPPLTPMQQAAYVTRLAKGASPAAACAALGLSVSAVLMTMDGDEAFRRQLQQIDQLLSQNVAAALYRSAMEGNVSAQTFLLKHRPPPDWQDDTDPTATLDDVERLNDDELAALLRQTEHDLPPEAAP